MSGYGKPDDEQERAILRVEEQVALARSLLPTGPGASHCVKCSESIPEARRLAMKGCRLCVECQAIADENKPTFKQPWAT